jgi:hypothetical protein
MVYVLIACLVVIIAIVIIITIAIIAMRAQNKGRLKVTNSKPGESGNVLISALSLSMSDEDFIKNYCSHYSSCLISLVEIFQ